MRANDIVIEVRLRSFGRVGQVPMDRVQKAQFIKRFNAVGAWNITLPNDVPIVNTMKNAGTGILVWLYDKVIFSGPMVTYTVAQGSDDLKGKTTIIGADDLVMLNDPLLYPVPSQPDVTLQIDGWDDRSGKIETVMKGYVNANFGPAAPAVRKTGLLVESLQIEPDGARGGNVQAHARFDIPGEFFQGLCAAEGTMGFDIVQDDGGLPVFKTYVRQDRSATIRMDVDNDLIKSTESSVSAPSTTVAIVAGQGQGELRTFVQYTDATAQAAQAQWGRRIEKFIDQRQTNEGDELNQAGVEEIETNGRTTVSLKVTPADSLTMLYGRDWFVGDTIGVVVDDQVLTDVVTEAIVSIEPTGVKIGATIGDPVGYDWEAGITKVVIDHEQRLSNLERGGESAQLASTADAVTGTSTDTAVTPAGVAAAIDAIPDPAVGATFSEGTGITYAGAIASRTGSAGQASTRVYKIGRAVTFNVSLDINTTDIAADAQIVQVPTGYRPFQDAAEDLMFVMTSTYGVYGIAHVYMNTDGWLRIGRMASGSALPITGDDSMIVGTMQYMCPA